MDKTTRRRILSYLYEIYRTNPYEIRETEEIAETLGIPFLEVKSELIYLHKKEFVDSYSDNYGDNWSQKINEKGIDELEKLETEASVGINHSLDVEVTHEKFQGIMKVFISHKFEKEDQKLALILRNMLRSKNIDGYMAETKREYELLIGDKIRGEIDASNFVVGIITKESENSASVNQELGYALGRGIPIVIMIEKWVSHGVLTHGRETEEFSRQNFSHHCTNVMGYILERGTTKRKSAEQTKNLEKLLSSAKLLRDKFRQTYDFTRTVNPTSPIKAISIDLTFIQEAIIMNESFLREKKLLGNVSSDDIAKMLHTLERFNAQVDGYNSSNDNETKRSWLEPIYGLSFVLSSELSRVVPILDNVIRICDEELKK